MGLERGVGQGFLWACLGPQLRAEKAQEEDQDWLLGSGKGLLGERRGCNEKGTLSQTPPTQHLGQLILASVAFRPFWSVEPRSFPAILGGLPSPSLPAAWSLLGAGSGSGAGGSGPSPRGLRVGPGSTLVVKVISTVVAYNGRNPWDFSPYPHPPHTHLPLPTPWLLLCLCPAPFHGSSLLSGQTSHLTSASLTEERAWAAPLPSGRLGLLLNSFS